MRTFTVKTFEYFMAIRCNNNREFFQSTHDWYVDSVRGPLLDLVTALSPFLLTVDDGLETVPNRCVSRINRDIRFAKDKSPYRDYLWVSFWPKREDSDYRPGFWFDISDRGAGWGMGMYLANKRLMNGLRRQLREHPGDMAALLRPLSEFDLTCDAYRRMAVPEIVPEALRPFYVMKQFGFRKTETDWNALCDPDLWRRIQRDYEKLTDMYHYITSIVEEEDGLA